MSTAPETTIEPVVPAGVDPVDGLTVRELDMVSRQLGVDVVEAVSRSVNGLRWAGLARVAWLWDRRRDPTAKLDRWLDMDAEQLTAALRLDEPETPAGDDPGANPTEPAPAS